MWWAYLLSGFLGGVVAIAALIIALALASKWGNIMSISFGGHGITYYKQMELLESAVRPGGIYVKYKNTGEKLATTACFRIKVFDKDDELIAESEEAAYEDIPPGEVQEHIIVSHELRDDWIQNPEHRIDVSFRYGYLE